MFNMFSRSESSILQKRGYLLGDDLGEGSYAKVKSATWKRPAGTVKVALKIIDIPHIPKDFKEKFLPRELEIIRILNHNNVIKTMEIFSGGKKTYISLEFAGHGDMLSYIQLRGALSEHDSVKLFKQIANGLQYLHKNGVVHRDLKCENILLSKNDVIKIADFGFARRMTTNDLSKTFCGSAAYAPPEILQGVPYDGRVADVWSIGVILFVMNCAIMPFRDGSIRTLLLDQQMPLRYTAKLEKSISSEAKSMMKSLLTYSANIRPNLPMILQHEWLKKEFETGGKSSCQSQSPEAILSTEQEKMNSATVTADAS